MWKTIKGYKYPYRINEDACVEVLKDGTWLPIKARICGNRAVVNMRKTDGKQIRVAVVTLMANAFMGGRQPGCCIRHKNRARLNNELWNLEQVPRNKCNELSKYDLRKPVVKIDREGKEMEFYGSVQDAARANYMSRMAVVRRCRNQLQDPFSLTGFSFRYDR